MDDEEYYYADVAMVLKAQRDIDIGEEVTIRYVPTSNKGDIHTNRLNKKT